MAVRTALYLAVLAKYVPGDLDAIMLRSTCFGIVLTNFVNLGD